MGEHFLFVKWYNSYCSLSLLLVIRTINKKKDMSDATSQLGYIPLFCQLAKVTYITVEIYQDYILS